MINGSFRKYLEEAIGSDNALVAFLLLTVRHQLPSGAILSRREYVLKDAQFLGMSAEGYFLKDRNSPLTLIFTQEHIMSRIRLRCSWDMPSEGCWKICRGR